MKWGFNLPDNFNPKIERTLRRIRISCRKSLSETPHGVDNRDDQDIEPIQDVHI